MIIVQNETNKIYKIIILAKYLIIGKILTKIVKFSFVIEKLLFFLINPNMNQILHEIKRNILFCKLKPFITK
jgi:hypothetical protein